MSVISDHQLGRGGGKEKEARVEGWAGLSWAVYRHRDTGLLNNWLVDCVHAIQVQVKRQVRERHEVAVALAGRRRFEWKERVTTSWDYGTHAIAMDY